PSYSDAQPTLELSAAVRAQLVPELPALQQRAVPQGNVFGPGGAAIRHQINDAAEVSAEQVLDHRALVGAYGKGGGAPPAWERAPKEKSRGVWTCAVLAFWVGVGGSGRFAYSQKLRSQRVAQAETRTAEVGSMLHGGKLSDLVASDEKLNAVLELDSRNQKAGRLWLENRVLNSLMSPGEVTGIDAAIHRARTLELPEEQLAFGQVASFMAEGDLAGAAALLSRWDKRAAK